MKVCDLCGMQLGTVFYDVNGIEEEGFMDKNYHYDLCPDCMRKLDDLMTEQKEKANSDGFYYKEVKDEN